MAETVRDVEFDTLDGVKLRGSLFSAGQNRPCIIMTHGLAGTKEQYLMDFAQRFQQSGFTVLVYDHRNWGASDGQPRNETDPLQQVKDYYDAFDYAASLPDTDPSKIVYWGTSMSGGVAIMAAALDKRVAAVIVQAPFVSALDHLGPAAGFITPLVFHDRAGTRSTGTWTKVPLIPASLEEAVSGTSRAILNQPDVIPYAEGLIKRGHPMEDSLTLQSIGHMLLFEPNNFIDRIGPRPLLMVVGENDTTTSTRAQLQAFHRALEPKTLHVIRGIGHFGVYYGDAFEENIKVQLQFLAEIFGE